MKSRKKLLPRGISAAALVSVSAFAISCASATKTAEKPDAMASVSIVAARGESIRADIGPIQDRRKTLVVYFTSGNASQRVATDLAELFDADVEQIVESKARNWSFMSGGAAAIFGASPKIQAPKYDPANYDRVFVLTPVWAWRLAPPVRTWLKTQRGRLPEAAYGTISGDTEPEKIVAQMAKVAKRQPFAYAGFSKRDFSSENRDIYLEKIRYLTGLLPRIAGDAQ